MSEREVFVIGPYTMDEWARIVEASPILRAFRDLPVLKDDDYVFYANDDPGDVNVIGNE